MLIERLTRALRTDERVRGLWLTGSLARGTADAFSDIDLLAVLRPGADGPPGADDRLVEEAAEVAESWLETFAPAELVYRRQNAFGRALLANLVTTEWDRIDLLLGGAELLEGRSRATVRALFDDDRLTERLPEHRPVVPPSKERVSRLVWEFFRVLALFPVAAGRGDAVVAASGSTLVRSMLIELMTEAVEVEERGGALHLASLLDPADYSTLVMLPPIEATLESAIAVHRACAEAFTPRALAVCRRTGVDWPEEFAAAARQRFESGAASAGSDPVVRTE